jgi:hypothetical protein
MPVISGEAIRLMNYIDDISTTLRRIVAGLSALSEDEKKRLAEYMKKSEPNYPGVLDLLEKGK